MSDLDIKEKLEDLYKKIINKEEKKVDNEEINNLINNFIKNIEKEREKYKNLSNTDVVDDVIESLKIINEAYRKKKKSNFFSDKIKWIENIYTERNKNLSKLDDSIVEVNNNGDEIDEFEIYEPPIIKEINEECDKILDILKNNESKKEEKDIDKLKDRIFHIKDEINKLKPIDNEVIKRLNDQINTIRKESDKISRIQKILKDKNKANANNLNNS
jgi:hypothetical protein